MEKKVLLAELRFKAVRSSGPGGQNVNKVASKVVLSFDVLKSNGLSEDEKQILYTNLSSRLTFDTVLQLHCDENRSQLKNKVLVTQRFFGIIEEALFIPKERKPTKIPKSIIRKRIKDKKNHSEIKKSRRKPDID